MVVIAQQVIGIRIAPATITIASHPMPSQKFPHTIPGRISNAATSNRITIHAMIFFMSISFQASTADDSAFFAHSDFAELVFVFQ